MDIGHLYAAQRADITALVKDLDEVQAATNVPGTPLWTVRDLLSHLAGLSADLAAGRLAGAGTAPWTSRQVAERKGRGVVDLVREWQTHGPEVEELLPSMGRRGHAVALDITMHGDDLREALSLPLGTTEGHAFVLEMLVGFAGKRVTEAGLPALRLEAGEQSWVLGEGQPTTSLRAPAAGELGRVVGGRRSNEQLLALEWDGDPAPYLPLLPLFAPGT